MHKSVFLSLIFSLIFSGLFAQNNTAKIISSADNELIISFSVKDYKFKRAQTPKGDALIINADDMFNSLEAGSPDIPKFTKALMMPDKASGKIEIISAKYTDTENILLAPSKGNLTRDIDPAAVPYTFGDVYQKDAFYPAELANLGKPYIMRDYRGQTINIFPFRYNPVTKTLRVYTEIIVKITYSGTDGINPLNRTRTLTKIDSEFKNIYNRHFLNYQTNSRYTPVEESGNMLIICYDDWLSAMQPFVDWKNTIGRPTEIVSVTDAGGTADAIGAYIDNYYDTKGLAYLLLVGDEPQIPTNQVSGDSDNAYAYQVGDDHYLDFFVGRFSAESQAQVETQVLRTIEYEQGNKLAQDWLNIATGMCSDQGPGDDDEMDFEHYQNIEPDLLGFTYTSSNELFDGSQGGNDADGNPTPAMLSEIINNGTGIINYTGHGSETSWSTSGFSNTDINNLTNDNKLPFICSVGCVNGAFVGRTCFAETWLRAENNSEPTGAIAIVASTINQSWAPPMVAQDEMVDILTESYENNIKRTFGGISVNGMFLMNDETEDYAMTDTWTIFGDPSLMVRTDNPTNMNITHNQELIVGEQYFTVNCDFEGAFVCLSRDNQIIGTASVSGGSASVPVSGVNAGETLTVTLTGFNKITYSENITAIAPEDAYVILDSYEISGAQTIDYNSTDFIDITLKNVGPEDALNVKATLTTSDTYITNITDCVDVDFGTVSGDNGTAGSSNKFSITTAQNTPDGHIAQFTLTVTDGTDTWTSDFQITINAPDVCIGNLTIINDDNADGILDPGETADITYEITNCGHANGIFSGILSKTDNNNYLTLGTENISDISIDAETSQIFSFTNISASASTPTETTVDLNLSASASNGSENQTSETIKIGILKRYPINTGDTLNICEGMFTDSNKDGQYSNNESYTMIIMPGEAGNKITVNFESFDVEENSSGGCWDYLSVYDGTSTSANKIGDFCNENPPAEISATNTDGALTFVFSSDEAVTGEGWEARISCTPPATSKENLNANKIKLYPNPTNDIFYIEQTIGKSIDYEVYGITGELIIKGKSADMRTKIDLTSQTTGLYFIKITAKDLVMNQVIVKQ